nr:uncharacterized protein LOC109785632 [Aegilops tauschii subsp. strangulata]
MSSQPEIAQVVRSGQAAEEADEHYDPFKDPKRRPTKSKDPAWKYAFWPDLNKRLLLQCNLCAEQITSGPCRMKKHLAGGFTIVSMCTKTTPAIRKEMHGYLKTHSFRFKNLDGDEGGEEDGEEGAEQENCAGSSRASNSNASTKRKSEGTTHLAATVAKKQGKSIADRIRKTPEEVVADRHMSKGTQKNMKDYNKKTEEQKDDVDGHVADFLYENCLPLNIVNSRSWEILLESIGQYGSDYISPTYHQVREPLLERAKMWTDNLKGKHEVAWKEYGCSLMSDGWTDMTGRHLINLLVNSPEGTFFLGTANVSFEIVDANLVAKLLSEQIDAISLELVVQVVSDNGSNYKAAGRLLMEKYPTMYWTPCAAHCLDLMLEDIGKIKEFSRCIAKAKRTTRFIYAHGKVLDLMRSLNGKQEIVRPGATRFATSFLTLESMWKQRQTLKTLFVSPQWYANRLKDNEGGKAAEATVISVSFWQSVEHCMRASQPLLRALRIADGDETPAMAEMWAAMDFAKTRIKEALTHKPNLLGQVVAIVDKRWDNQMEQKLHGAAFFLNPNKFFAIKESNKRQASRLRSMFNDVLWKMVPDDEQQTTISREADDYELGSECFSKPLSIKDRDKKSPLLWRNAYGGLAFDLQTLAKRIISLCCSASGCERNWSVFAHIHTKGRNRLEYKRLNKLSYVSYNRKMEARFQNLREQGSNAKKSSPLILEEFEWDNEWVDINAEMVLPWSSITQLSGRNPLLRMVEADDDDDYVVSFFEASSWRVSMLEFARISSSSGTVDVRAAAPGGF